MMIIPMRCFSCGKPISHLWVDYSKRVEKGEDKAAVLDDLDLHRYCCRRMFLAHTELIDEVMQYKRF